MGRLGPSWAARWGQVAVLGASWGRLGRSWTRFWRQDGTKNRSKNRSKVRSNFKIDFWSYTLSFWSQHVRILGHLGRLGFSKIIGFPYVRLIFLKFVGRRFGRQLFRPKCAPRGRTLHQDERRTRKVRGQGRTWRGLTETLDRDFGQRLWTETLDRDFGQILCPNLARSSPVGRRIRHRACRDRRG